MWPSRHVLVAVKIVSLARTSPATLKFDLLLGKMMHLHVLVLDATKRAHVRDPHLYLRSGWTDRAQNWYVIRDWSERWLPQVSEGDNLHVRTCRSRFYISKTAGPIALKVGMLPATCQKGGFHTSEGYHSARAHVQGRPARFRKHLDRSR